MKSKLLKHPLPLVNQEGRIGMLNHVTIGVTDLGRGSKFFDALFSIIGAKDFWPTKRTRMYSTAPNLPRVAIYTLLMVTFNIRVMAL